MYRADPLKELSMRLEYLLDATAVVAVAAFVGMIYCWARFSSKLQDALARQLVQRAWLPKGRGDITWIISWGEMVPGAAPYRRGFIIAFVTFGCALVALVLIGGLGHARPELL